VKLSTSPKRFKSSEVKNETEAGADKNVTSLLLAMVTFVCMSSAKGNDKKSSSALDADALILIEAKITTNVFLR